MRRLLIFALGMSVGSASAGGSAWVYQEQKDAMRDAVTRIATVQSTSDSPASASGLSAFLTVTQESSGDAGVVIGVDGDAPQCSKDGCEVLAKFDNGAINTLMGPPANGDRFFLPWGQRAVAAALQYTDRLVIEINLRERGKQQFVFQTAGLPIEIKRRPESPVLKYQFGVSAKDVEGLGESRAVSADEVCYTSMNPGPMVMDGLSGSGMVCFVKDRLYLVVLEVSKGGKRAALDLQKRLDIIYGEGESFSKDYIRWPKVPDGVDGFTSGASRMFGVVFVADKSLQLLAPERERQK